MEDPLYIKALLGENLDVSDVEILRREPGSAVNSRLRCMPGASALHLMIASDHEVFLRAEVPATGGETVALQLEVDEDGEVHLTSAGRDVLVLPLDVRFEPPPLLRPAPTEHLDLSIVIDGTSRFFEVQDVPVSSPLLGKKQWEDCVALLSGFFEALMQRYPTDLRVSILSFGDQEPPGAVAPDLMPRYRLFPVQSEGRALRPIETVDVLQELLDIPSSPGGDFVDAVADALEACAELRWRPEARKLVVLFGDSPGHSIQYPAPTGSDAGVRERDVDLQAMKLHELGVEIVTIYLPPSEGLDLQDVGFKADLLRFAREQYARLASLPEMAFDARAFDPEQAADLIVEHKGPIARGPALGELIEVLPQEDLAAS